ncbi:unnamed protein product [Brassicogethes aeneus]|nr:unnamed protein product [Brassicogethes aeneus]
MPIRPHFKRLNGSLRRVTSQRVRRPASISAPPDVVPQCEQNGLVKCGSPEGPEIWASSFEKLLEDPLGLHCFTNFLKKEFSAENIYFWAACERYRRLPCGTLRRTEAKRIYEQHMCHGAPEPVNVDSQARQRTENSLLNPDDNAFDLAQKQILNLMKFDSYPRFLKSDIYKQCLSGDIGKIQMDMQLSMHFPAPTPKLKKSLSNAEDRRRKSLLPRSWHKKSRSKSKDRGEIEYNQHKRPDIRASSDNLSKDAKSDIHSSRSSLTSLDLSDISKSKLAQEDRPALCRVKLSNGYTTVVQIKESEPIDQLVSRLLEKRGINYSSYEVTTNKHPKALDTKEPSTQLAGCEAYVEQRVVFKLDLPNKKCICVKSKYTKLIMEVLRPILHKYHYNLDQVNVTENGRPLDVQQPVTAIDQFRLKIQLKDDNDIKAPIKISPERKLEEITNKVFEDILQEKSASVLIKPCKSDRGSVKSEDWGSEHSSNILSKFLRRDSSVQDRKKKFSIKKVPSTAGSTEDVADQGHVKKPLIAKLKAGASKLQVNCKEKDEILEGVTKAQGRRLEDQRGTEINTELPDFLKDKENGDHKFRKPLRRSLEPKFVASSDTNVANKTATAKTLKTESHVSNYENRSAFLNGCEVGSKSSSSTPTKGLGVAVVEGRSPASNGTPPPLPPKPKIIPIKPQNWGHNGFHKTADKNSKSYLEQPTSSFV